MTSTESSNRTSTTGETRAHRVLKRKFCNNPFRSNPRRAQKHSTHPFHNNTKNFLQVFLPFFPQNIHYYSDRKNEQPNYVNENALFATFSLTSFYHFSNPLSLPLFNNPDDNELCSTRLYHLTPALQEKHFTDIGYNQTLTRFTAQKANRFSIDQYDHGIARSNAAIFLDDDTNANTQLAENFLMKSRYAYTINCMNKKYDNIISTALRAT